MLISTDKYPGLKIFKDNWKKIRDTIRDDSFIIHPSYEALKQLNNDAYQNVGWSSCGVIVNNELVKKYREIYKFTIDLYNQLDLPNKLGVGFTKFEAGGYVKTHNDKEASYRYHLCLQGEENKSVIYSGDDKLIYSPGDDFILNTLDLHSVYNNSKTTARINLCIDFVLDASMIKNYSKYFGADEYGANVKNV